MNQSIQELIQKNKSAVDEYFSALYNATDYKRADIIGVKLSVKSLNASFAKALIDAVIESRKKKKKKTIVNMLQDDEMFNERGMDGVKAWNDAQDDTIKELLAIKKLL